MKASVISGSIREGRQSHKAAKYVAKSLENRGVETRLIDLAQEPLPVMGYEPDHKTDSDSNAVKISRQLHESDLIILVTPEYHGSFSGALKNALDHFTPEFDKKPVGVVAASAGRMAGINASTQLQHVILSLGAFPVPRKLLVPEVHNAFNESGEPNNEKLVTMTSTFLDELLWFADAVSQKHVIT